MNLETTPTLNEDELNLLGNLLESEYEQRDALDFFATHGALTALLLGPIEYHIEQLENLIFEQPPTYSATEKTLLTNLLTKLADEIFAYLEGGEDFPIPCELDLTANNDEEMAPLQSWCMGFVCTVLAQESAWYAEDKEEAAALLLFPIMYASGLFLEEVEMAQIDDDEQMSAQCCSHIAANVSELYLLYHGM